MPLDRELLDNCNDTSEPAQVVDHEELSFEFSIQDEIASKSRRVFNLPTGYYFPGIEEPEEAVSLSENEQAAVDLVADPIKFLEFAERVVQSGRSRVEITQSPTDEGSSRPTE